MNGRTPHPGRDPGRIPDGVPGRTPDESRAPPHEDPIRDHWREVFWMSMSAAIVVHFAVFLLAPTFHADALEQRYFEAVAFDVPPEVEIPPPPPEVARPAIPMIASAAISEDITIAPTTFDANPVDYLPPPPPPSTVSPEQEISRFTPYSVAPVLLNRAHVEKLLEQEYPPLLRQADIDGVVLIWLQIDSTGAVVATEIKEPSGYESFDAAARRVSRAMHFRPAFNRDKAVEVWVSLPIVFSIRHEPSGPASDGELPNEPR
jgi:protein TonB